MPYFMRYVVRDDHRLSLEKLEQELQRQNQDYCLKAKPETSHTANLQCGEEFLGVISICRSQEQHFQAVVGHMRERLAKCQGDKDEVVELLNDACAFVALQVVWGDREAEYTQDLLDPLWGLLFERWEGLLQSDDDGWHDPFGLILEVA